MTRLNQSQCIYLDGVRGVCAQLVMLGHAYAYSYGQPMTWEIQSMAVAIFFLLSGFLIGHSAFGKFSNADYGFRDYMAERFARIYVALVPALVLALALDLIAMDSEHFSYGSDVAPAHFVGSLLMLQDFPLFQLLRRLGIEEQWWFFTSFGSAKPLWTISIEFWIYVTFGLLVFIAARGTLRRHAWWAVPLLAFAAIEPTYHFFSGFGQCLTMMWILGAAAGYVFLHWSPHESIAIGAIWVKRTTVLWVMVSMSVLALAGRALSRPVDFYELQYITYVAGLLFGLLFLLTLAPRLRILAALRRPCAVLANYSYSLYLTHNSVVVFLHVHLPQTLSSEALMAIDILVSNAVALGFWWLFERHHRRLSLWLRSLGGRTEPSTAAVLDKS